MGNSSSVFRRNTMSNCSRYCSKMSRESKSRYGGKMDHDGKNSRHGYALITGASSGIGREFAIQLAGMGYPLILVARREGRLIRLAAKLRDRYGIDSIVIGEDLSEKESCYELFDIIKNEQIEIVINNAGFGDCSSFADGDIDKELAMIDVNVKAMHLVMKLSLQKMLCQFSSGHENDMTCSCGHDCRCGNNKCGCSHGYILNVASSAGLLPAGPYMATYYATKSYVASLTQAVAEEQRQARSGIYIGCLCPGPVDTEFDEVANVHFSLPGITARECVAHALDGMQKGQTVIVPGATMKMAVAAGRFVPRRLLVRMTGSQQMKKMRK